MGVEITPEILAGQAQIKTPAQTDLAGATAIHTVIDISVIIHGGYWPMAIY